METNRTYEVTQDFFYYEAVEGDNNEAKNRSSGAYIFRPLNHQKNPIYDVDSVTFEAYEGKKLKAAFMKRLL
jgi:lysosomal alpha-mannosidase